MAVHLVTGGAGFLGSHILRAGLAEPALADDQWVVLDDLSGGFQENVPQHPRVTFVRGSINDAELVDHLFGRYPLRFVYHLAAYAAEGLSHFIRRFNYTNNVVGSATVVNGAVRHRAECVVFTSSIAVYGAAQVPMTERTIPQPEDPYGIAKYAVELDLRAAGEMFGLDYVILRPHNVYGEHQNIGDRYRNVVGIFMNRLLQGKPMPIFGDGEQQRAFTYVGDVAPLIVRAPLVRAARNQVFNIGADHHCTVNELAHHVAEAMGVPARLVHLPARQEVMMALADHSRCRAAFPDQGATPLEEGLQRMAAWVKTVGVRTSPEFTEIEVTRNLPASWQTPDT